MKHLPSLIIAFAAIAAFFPCPLAAQDDADPASSQAGANAEYPKQIGILVEYIQLDHGEINRGVREHLGTQRADATVLHEGLAELIAAGKARRIGSSHIVTRSGQRAKIESIIERIYPTEFDPPEIPQKLHGPIDGGLKLTTPLTPTAFYTRNTGITLEVDPVVGADGVTIDLNVASEIVEYLGEKEYGQGESRMSQPVFNTIKSATAVSLRGGEWVMLGMHTPARPLKAKEIKGGRERVIALARADVLEIKPKVVQSADPDAFGPMVISLLAEYIEAGEADAAALLSRHAASSSAGDLREELSALEKEGKAMLLESASLVTRSGQRAKAESVNEWIFPTEMDPPEIPQELTGPIADGVDLITPLSFTAFDTRNVGTTLEVDPVASQDHEFIDVNLAPEIVAYFGDTKHGRGKSKARMPVFATMKIATAVTVPTGDTILVGVHMPLDQKTRKVDPSKRVFLFLTAACLEKSP